MERRARRRWWRGWSNPALLGILCHLSSPSPLMRISLHQLLKGMEWTLGRGRRSRTSFSRTLWVALKATLVISRRGSIVIPWRGSIVISWRWPRWISIWICLRVTLRRARGVAMRIILRRVLRPLNTLHGLRGRHSLYLRLPRTLVKAYLEPLLSSWRAIGWGIRHWHIWSLIVGPLYWCGRLVGNLVRAHSGTVILKTGSLGGSPWGTP